ncbi:hypothetical protein CPB84DRAFT_1840763 [Gymnopilus junonius]|uniref:Uncharacterized protein n=1 Tax=Gymnopilus junonius TaxID=109634 RepID=A0A9P5TV42_GYMJU|nr:hypothetical protein CPB84DRAFT_1840763 [Gymnopilus junonius]
MPSIRIRSRAYSALDSASGGRNADALALVNSTIPFPVGTPPAIAPSSTPSSARPVLPDPSPSPFLTPTRPRAFSTSTPSRVHAHCTSRSSQLTSLAQGATPISARRTSTVPGSPSPYPNAGETLTIEGLQTDIRLASHGEPGRVESSINLPHIDGDENNDHHHDDVVEHLDVIGMLHFHSKTGCCPTSFPLDSQVGAVSSLTNAANAILIPPSAWYSRKPLVVLPSTPRRQTAGDDFPEYEDSLDRHVEDVLNRPSKVRRTIMGIWSFLKTPMGIITGIYGFLVVFWGAAIVIFLARIINFHNPNTQGFWIEVSSQVETVNEPGLFTITSIGLIPSRVLDTYRVWKIWRYKRRTMKLREKACLPQLFDVDDLPDPMYDPNYVHVLTEAEQKDLHRQQRKFQYSQTWYRAHGTETHRAFPINMALIICFLNDGNSIFQIFLCGTMWGLNRFDRPPWTTGVLIPGSFLCGIGAAVVIWRGGERTKRVEEVRERLRVALSQNGPLADGQLPQSLSRIPRSRVDSEKTSLKGITEEGRDTNDSTTNIDEHMIIPSD